MFPDNVERFDAKDEHVNATGEFVLASEFDRLLALYRETRKLRENDLPLMQAEVSAAHLRSEVAEKENMRLSQRVNDLLRFREDMGIDLKPERRMCLHGQQLVAPEGEAK